MANLNRHLFEVECRLVGPLPVQRFQMPSWIPGSYLLREFARHIVAIEAYSDGQTAALEQLDHHTWCCRNAGEELIVKATIHALDATVRGAFLDSRRAYFNGPCLFIQPLGHETEDVELEILAPTQEVCADWRVATAMQATAINARGFGTYYATDYDELLDHPVEIGEFESVGFMACGVPHRLIVAGRFDADLDRVGQDLTRVCETTIKMFGSEPPFDRYCFLGFAADQDKGGLEHRASSSLQFRRDDLPKIGEPGVPVGYQRFLSLASHEYFHAWHVKRTKPAAFVPYQLDRRNQTRLLWVFEGITSYYQELVPLRSGLISREVFLRRLGELLTRVYRTPGRFRQSLADSSFNAWDVLYKPEPNAVNLRISYYSKGALIALALDLTMRCGQTDKSLDDVMKAMWERYGEPGIGVPEDGFESLAVELGGQELAPFFDRMIRGTEDPSLSTLLHHFGLALEFTARTGIDDRGGTACYTDTVPLSLGVAYRLQSNAIELTAVFDDGPAQRAGLSPGDVLIALDRLRVGAHNLQDRIERFDAGERVTVSFFRGEELLEAGLVVQPAPLDTCHLRPSLDPSARSLERLNAWLTSPPDGVHPHVDEQLP